MKRFALIAMGFATLMFTGCDKDKDIELKGFTSEKVAFTATNITVSSDPAVDSAESIAYRYGFYLEGKREKPSSFTVDYTYEYLYEQSPEERMSLDITLEDVNALWAGGNNDILITYTPTRAEEKSAKFTMPDGTTVELSRENPSYVWHLNSDSMRKALNNGWQTYELPIYAISRYDSGGNEYVNCGYVLIMLYYEGTNLQYSQQHDVWFMQNWFN